MSRSTVSDRATGEEAPTCGLSGADRSAMEHAVFAERRKRRNRVRLQVWAIRCAVAIVFVGGWYFASERGLINPLFISSPDAVAEGLVDQLADATFWTDVTATFAGALAGLAAGGLLGIVTGVVFSRSEVLERAATPFLTLANSLPRPALAPIFILWFGLGFGPKALVAGSVVYFVLLTSTLGALRGIDHDVVQLARSLSMSPVQRFLKIELPAALPSIVGALRLGAVYAVLGAVLSEMVGAYYGLGQRLVVLTSNFKVAESFAVLLFMGIMSMVLDYAIKSLEHVVASRSR
ncbi:ABC transporter permease [Saccharopolyspora sp. WRP15-2]|uniref:ABC transporter permease n=1 Tax=Saccharopolyspora oryzae TaxID=2997343 RepID=A0ABT4UWS7_9PSEU|nr:ABC transporter permease [Saccharopolyspora oryzae]MDA3626170.1 ABC transporter permease [Saccharopolyspora oryzae]